MPTPRSLVDSQTHSTCRSTSEEGGRAAESDVIIDTITPSWQIIMASAVASLTSDDVARSPPGVGRVPLSIKFSPDGSLLTYLFPDTNGVRQVYAVDLTTTTTPGRSIETSSSSHYNPYKLFDASATTFGSGTDSLAEQLRKERMRLFVSGVSCYEWVQGSSGCRIMLPLHGCVLLYDRDAGVDRPVLQVIYDGEATKDHQEQGLDHPHGPALDPHLSPTGIYVAYVLNDDMYVQQLLAGGQPQRLTYNGAKEGVSCGVADFIAQEEMDR